MNALTAKQEEVLAFLVETVTEKQIPPTHRQINARFKWKSNAAAKGFLTALHKKGFIRNLGGIARGIEIKPAAWEWYSRRLQGENEPLPYKVVP